MFFIIHLIFIRLDRFCYFMTVKRVEKPWGHEEWLEVNPRYVMKALFVDKGRSLSLQYHKIKEETIYVSSGVVEVTLGTIKDDGSYTLEPSMVLGRGEFVHIPPRRLHRFTASIDSILLEASTPELDDVVRLKDDYGREGTSAP
jgi:mannose-6-phosphate isomerase